MNEAKLLAVIAASWDWIGIHPEAIIEENDFGNLIIQDSEAKYWRLCPEELTCEVIARDQSALEQLSADLDFLEDWQMSRLVEVANAKLGPLPSDSKYYFVIPPVLGGSYSAENIQRVTLTELIGVSGSLARQINDLPDGSQIRLIIDEDKSEINRLQT